VDIRFPVGAIFAIYGVLLIGWGLASGDVAPHHMLLGLNVNVTSGIGMLIFGGSFLALSWRGGPTARSTTETGRTHPGKH
jgi:hypothetical protein